MGVNVPWTCRILASQAPRPEHTVGPEQIHVVGTYEVLGHPDNRSLQARLSVVVRRILTDVPRQLRDLDLGGQIPLEARKQNLALTGLESVHHARNGALDIVHGEVNQVPVDEIRIRHRCFRLSHFERIVRVVLTQPSLSVIGSFLVECKVQAVIALGVFEIVLDQVHVLKVLLSFIVRARPKPLVVLDSPTLPSVVPALPLLELRTTVEAQLLFPPCHLYDRREQACDEPGLLGQRGPQRVKHVHDETLAVGSVRVVDDHRTDARLEVMVLRLEIVNAGRLHPKVPDVPDRVAARSSKAEFIPARIIGTTITIVFGNCGAQVVHASTIACPSVVTV